MNGTAPKSSSEVRSSAERTPAAWSCAAPRGWPVRTRATVARSRSSCSARSSPRGSDSTRASGGAIVGIPVLLQVSDQRRTEMAVGLLARIHAHVVAEQIERLLPLAQGSSVGGRVDQARAGQRIHAGLERRVYLGGVDDLVADQIGVGLAGHPLATGQDRLPCGAV